MIKLVKNIKAEEHIGFRSFDKMNVTFNMYNVNELGNVIHIINTCPMDENDIFELYTALKNYFEK